MKRAVLVLLALAGVGCALVVTASSTMRQAYTAGMPEPVPLALVGLLEVVNVAGTWTWLSDERGHVRGEAALGVALASLVTGLCGALTYGALGLVAPAGLLAAVHLVSRQLAPAPVAEPVPVTADDGSDPGPSAVEAVPGPGQVSAGSASGLAETAQQALDKSDVDPDPRVVDLARRLARGEDLTGPAVATELGLSERTGRRLLGDARTHLEQHQPLHLVTDRSENPA